MNTCNTCAYMVTRQYKHPKKLCANRKVTGGEFQRPLYFDGNGYCDEHTVFSAANAEEINDNFICEKQKDSVRKGQKVRK